MCFTCNVSSTLQKEMGAEMAAGKLPVWLKALGAKLAENSPSPYFVGDKITIADLQVKSWYPSHFPAVHGPDPCFYIYVKK